MDTLKNFNLKKKKKKKTKNSNTLTSVEVVLLDTSKFVIGGCCPQRMSW